MQHEDNSLIDAILALSSPEEATKELRRKKDSETVTVPKALESLLRHALEEKARRKQ
jgi:hypothetical protein